MKIEELYLLNTLRGFLLNKDPGSYSGSWNDLLQLASLHSITGILGYCVMKYPNEANAPIVPFMRGQCLNTIHLQTQRAAKMQALIQKMNEAGIDHLLFKGYVLKEYYPVPELRTFGDIDFLIRQSDREKMDTLMMQEGFLRKAEKEPVFSYIKENEYYEIHTDIMEEVILDNVDHQGYFSKVWEHAYQVGGHTWQMKPEYHFLYLLTHIAKHVSTFGAGVRMYFDIAVFIQHIGAQLDWEYIQYEASALKLDKLLNMTLHMVQEYFGIVSPIILQPIDRQSLDEFLEFTMAGGTFGYEGRDGGLIALRKEDDSSAKVSRTKAFFKRLFPSADYMKKNYAYLNGKQWLLPVAYIHRCIHALFHWDSYSKVIDSITNVDEDAVLKLRRLYKEIGL